ncbi:hypothetical protein THERMOS_2048 [Bathymodiolus thermophilus thioautotrophic gill symbiont]|uniref:Uncharacterized protein n=1 Tax=Bathymodiolus thermophilus thioautotrophic gill symbiont TaxID=2360 RepID=A0A8H8XEE6_9GAMM|nr:hypothetical protein THERMOS_2048 [Bathymodiolus thermophilus thioautotrophic gill symbiont]
MFSKTIFVKKLKLQCNFKKNRLFFNINSLIKLALFFV